MVWGIPLPKSFGQFWPEGSFEKGSKVSDDDWYGRLTAYYKEQSPDEQKRLFDFKGDAGNVALHYGSFPAYKFAKEPGARDNNGLQPPYGAIEPHEIPQSFDTEKTYKSLGALITVNNGMLAVDEPLKAIIERLEPGVHEFFPLEIRMPKGRTYPGSYSILRICQYFDAFSLDDTQTGSVREIPAYKETPGLIRLNVSKKALNGLAMRKAVFGHAHLWRDRTFGEDLTCISDELMAEIEQAGLRLPKHYKMMEV